MVYLSFGALVLVSFIFVPLRLGGWPKSPQDDASRHWFRSDERDREFGAN